MAQPAPPSPEQLTLQLEDYASSPSSSEQLVQLLRPPRLGLRSTPSLRSTYGAHAPFWPALARVWEVEAEKLASDDKASIPAVLALAAFLLSLCTQEPHNQAEAVTHIEPHLRNVLLAASSLFNLEDSAYTDMTRICCQALANLVTSNESIASSFFPQRLQLEETDNLIQRLLASPDHGTLQAVLIFLLNSIHGSRERALLLGTSKAGAAVLDRLMTIVGVLFEDETPEGIAHEEFHSDVFELSFAIVQQLIKLEVYAQAYEDHALMPDFAISPTLVTLLKFLDGHLSLAGQATSPAALALAPFLIRQLVHLSAFLIDEGAERVKNAADAATFQGLVLVLHCLCSMGLAMEQEERNKEEEREEEARVEMVKGAEAVVRLLRFSTTLLPPVSARPAPPTASPSPPASSTASGPAPASPTLDLSPESTAAIAQLQRTIVQFLGILSFCPPLTTERPTPPPRVKDAQDRVRESGGLELLLSMCQMDERNTTMREHALFAIRNLLKANQTSQDYVDAMKPQYQVGPNGELLDLPPPLRKE
ncbi:hypothetical protein JCM10450v2_005336 [Rhodotorula kratochvilovae]